MPKNMPAQDRPGTNPVFGLPPNFFIKDFTQNRNKTLIENPGGMLTIKAGWLFLFYQYEINSKSRAQDPAFLFLGSLSPK